MEKIICASKMCTGCEACVSVCPKHCISKHKNEDASWYLKIDESLCINCDQCRKVCPNNNPPESHRPIKAYAAWAENKEIHALSASGGIASSIYKYCLEQGVSFTGVYLDDDFIARQQLTCDAADIERFRNSKYTFSTMEGMYGEIKEELQAGKDVFFIGLPCQVAGIKNYINRFSINGKLVTADLVCHGTPPPEYLQQHMKYIEEKTQEKVKSIFFRDPVYKTDQFAFTVYSESILAKTNLLSKKSPTYIKYVGDDDLYQIGYHKALIYRDCCYQCKYAHAERTGDITLGDYHGLGQSSRYDYERDEVSCVLVNTELGREFWNRITGGGLIKAYERPVEEPLTYEKQLQAPSVAPPEREEFLNAYRRTGDYEASAEIAFSKYVRQNKRKKILPVEKIKAHIIRMIPRSLKEKVKEIKRKI